MVLASFHAPGTYLVLSRDSGISSLTDTHFALVIVKKNISLLQEIHLLVSVFLLLIAGPFRAGGTSL